MRVYFRETSHMQSFYFRETSHMRQNDEITLLFTDIGKSCRCRKFLVSQICLETLFAKLKFSQKFPNLQLVF